MSDKGIFYKIELSALVSLLGIIILFSISIFVVLIAPTYVDKSWTSPTSPYQVQIYELADPNVFISGATQGPQNVETVDRIQAGFSLLAFQESEAVRIHTTPELEKYVTRRGDKKVKLTSRLLLLRPSVPTDKKVNYQMYELFDPQKKEAFILGSSDTVLENWIDGPHYVILDPQQLWHTLDGVIFYHNPQEYLVVPYRNLNQKLTYRYDPAGEPIASVEELKSDKYRFLSRKELIEMGERIYASEGCFYCHTDQTRTLVQDLVLNGSDSYPAPPSSANEYIYQNVTFPGTKRNGPDLSRVGVKRPSRDWHKAHFWSPKSQSVGSIMPSFRHFFDFDPHGTDKSPYSVPNYRFEAVFQYLMTKGTRITPPTQAWWHGKDPIQTKLIIEGLKK